MTAFQKQWKQNAEETQRTNDLPFYIFYSQQNQKTFDIYFITAQLISNPMELILPIRNYNNVFLHKY